MDEPENNENNIPQSEEQKRLYYPPPNESFLVLAVALVTSLILGTWLMGLGKGGMIVIELLFLIPPIVYLQMKGYSIKRCLRWNAVPLKQLFPAVLIGVGLIVLLDEADRILNIFFPMPAEAYEVLEAFLTPEKWSDYVLLWGGAVFAAAICEESLFRGFMQLSMEAFGNVTRAVLFGALLFAIAHFNPWWLIQILILGVFLGYISWRANSVLPTMFIHALHNGLALWSGGLPEEGGWEWYNSGDHVSVSVLITAGAMLFVGMKIFGRQTEYTFVTRSDTNGSPES
jgi:membrane protease YdiL (CAAX protease family)